MDLVLFGNVTEVNVLTKDFERFSFALRSTEARIDLDNGCGNITDGFV